MVISFPRLTDAAPTCGFDVMQRLTLVGSARGFTSGLLGPWGAQVAEEGSQRHLALAGQVLALALQLQQGRPAKRTSGRLHQAVPRWRGQAALGRACPGHVRFGHIHKGPLCGWLDAPPHSFPLEGFPSQERAAAGTPGQPVDASRLRRSSALLQYLRIVAGFGMPT